MDIVRGRDILRGIVRDLLVVRDIARDIVRDRRLHLGFLFLPHMIGR